jgi:hypothetical protein
LKRQKAQKKAEDSHAQAKKVLTVCALPSVSRILEADRGKLQDEECFAGDKLKLGKQVTDLARY